MPGVTEPETRAGLLRAQSRWGHASHIAGLRRDQARAIQHHSKHGVMTQKITTIFHSLDACERADPLDPRRPVSAISALDRSSVRASCFRSRKANGGWSNRRTGAGRSGHPRRGHRRSSTQAGIADTRTAKSISAMRPGLSKAAAQWLVNKKVKLVGVDTAYVDHPLATSLGPHRNGPQIKDLLPEYKEATGREAIEGFSKMESGASHATRCGNSHHRECRRGSRRSNRQTLHLPGLSLEVA